MAKLLTEHWYTKDEVAQMMQSPELTAIQLKGYYLETDGARFRFIHDSRSAGKRRALQATVYDDLSDIEPIRKRKPVERVDSLMLSLIKDCKQTGRVPGLSDAKIREIVGQGWKDGRLDITTEEVRRVCQYFLDDAEKKRIEHESHMVTTPSNIT